MSGSGKSSLAFDTLYAEGQRRYVESLSSFARQFLGPDAQARRRPDHRAEPVDLDLAEDRAARTRAPRSARSPRFTIICGCSTPGWARDIARSAAGRSPPKPASRSSSAFWPCRPGTPVSGAGPVDPRPEGRISRPVRRPAEAGLRPRPGRWPRGPPERRPAAGPPDAAQHRGGDRSPGGRAQDPPAAGRGRRVGLAAGRGQPGGGREEEEKAEGGRRKAEDCEVEPDEAARTPTPTAVATSGLSALADYPAFRPLRLHALQPELRAAQPAIVQLQQPAGHVPRVQRPGADLHVRSRAADSRPEPLVPAGLHRAGRLVAGHGPLAAAHLSRRGRTAGAQARPARRARCWKRPGKNSTAKLQHALLWGTGDEHITFTWRSGPSGYKWGGTFEGIIPKLLAQYRTTQEPPATPPVGKVHVHPRLQRLRRAAAQRRRPRR